MRYPSPFRQRSTATEVAMTPMIDVVFMLLIFFVWTASFQVAEMVLPSSLITQAGSAPSELTPELEDLERIVVRVLWVDAQPAWLINDAPAASITEVRARLQAVAAVNVELPVLVDPQPIVPLGHVIDVYDLARQAGFAQVQFATPAA